MKRKHSTLPLWIYFFCFFLMGFNSFAQNASFSTIPSAVNGVINVCNGSTILFTNTTGQFNTLSGPITYSWNFGNGQTAITNGPHAITYNTAGSYTVTLDVNDNGIIYNQASVTVNVTNSGISQYPTLGSGNSCTQTSVVNGIQVFQTQTATTCSCPSVSTGPAISFLQTNNTNIYPPGTTINIFWGGNGNSSNPGTSSLIGSTTFPTGGNSLTNFPGQNGSNGHYANAGSYNLTYVVNYPNGCQYSGYAQMSWGGGSIDFCANSSLSACLPFEYNLCFDNQFPSNTYIIDWGDGSSNTYSYPNLPTSPNFVTHAYQGSCGANGVATPYTISVSATNQCPNGTVVNTQGPFFVSTTPTASFNANPSTTICQGQSITFDNTSLGGFSVINGNCTNDYDFSWLINNSNSTSGSGYAVTSGSLGDLYVVDGSDLLTVQFTNPGTYQVSLEAANETCGSDIEIKTIIVNPIAVIPTQTATICTGGTFSVTPQNNPPNTIIPSGTSYTWTFIDNPNVTGETTQTSQQNSITGTLTNLTNTAQVVNYIVTPNTNGCLGDTFLVQVTVVPGLIIPNYTTNICNNGTFSVTPVNTPPTIIIPTGTIFSWVPVNNPNVNGEVSGTGTTITGTLSTNITSPGQSVVYNVTASSGATCPAQTFQVTVFLNLINPPVIAQDQTVCSGGNPAVLNATTAATGTGTLSYQWMSSANGTNWTPITNTNNPSYDPPSGIAATTYYQVIATSTLNGVSCAAPSNDVLITVNTLNPGVIGSTQTICSGGDPASISTTTPASGAGSLSYQWQSSTTSATSGFTNISGATGTSFDPPAGVSTTTYYQLVVSGLLNGQTCTAITAPVTVTVNNISPGVISQNQTVCLGGNPANITFTTAPTGTGLSYQWQSSTTGPSSGFTNISGATASNYDPSAGITTSTYYQVIVTSNLNATGCPGVSNSILVTVNDVSASVISGTQTICSGGDPNAFTITTPATGSGTINYQWQSSTTSSTSGFSNISGATSATYDPPSGLTTTTYYQVIVTSVLNGVSCSTASNALTVNVNTVSAGSIGASQTVCSGGNPSAFVNSIQPTGTSGGTLSYQWQSSTTSASSGFSAISGATTVSYDPPAGLTQTTYYQLVVTSTLNGVNCSATSNAVTVNVNNISASVIGSDQTVCSGGDPAAFTITTAAAGSSAPTYVWQSSTTSSTSGFTTITGATSATYNPPSGLTNTTYYQVIATSTLNGVACFATSNPITVTVNNVNSGTISANQTICSGGDPIALSNSILPSGTGTLTYQWQSSTTSAASGFSNISGANNTTYDPPSGQTLTTYFQLVVTSTLNGVSCTSTTTPITITVNTINPGAIGNDQTICSGGNPTLINPTAVATGSGVLSYVWQSSTTSPTSGFSPISGATSASYDPPIGLTQTTYFQLTITSTLNGIACSSNTNTVAVTVNNVTPSVIGTNQTILFRW